MHNNIAQKSRDFVGTGSWRLSNITTHMSFNTHNVARVHSQKRVFDGFRTLNSYNIYNLKVLKRFLKRIYTQTLSRDTLKS